MHLTADRIRHLYRYCPETGLFMRRIGKPGMSAGRIAGTRIANGRIKMSVDNVQYYAHRLAFLWMTGEWPSGEVDHVNGIPDDNRWRNLRVATSAQNKHNARIRSDNTSGYKGVTWDKSRKKWAATIHSGGKKHFLGYHDNIEDAASAYEKAASERFGDFANTG